MGTSRFRLELGPQLDEEMERMARAQGISKAEAVCRALTGYANLRRLVTPDRELILRRKDAPWDERRVVVL